MGIGVGRRVWLPAWFLAGISMALGAGPGVAQRFEYVITFDNVVVRGIEGTEDTPEVAHRELPVLERSSPLAENDLEQAKRAERPADPSRKGADLNQPTRGEYLTAPLSKSVPDQSKRVERPGSLPKITWDPLDSQLPFAPGRGSANPNFVQAGFLVEAFWALRIGTREGFFKRAHFHPPDLSSGFEAQHLGNPTELHGIFIRSLDGKSFSLKSLRYRVTRNRQIPGKPLSLEGFSNFNVNVLVGRTFDPRGPIRVQFVSFPVGLPVGNDMTLPWFTLRIFGFELVDRVYIASSASVDFDDIVLTRREPPPAPMERREEDK